MKNFATASCIPSDPNCCAALQGPFKNLRRVIVCGRVSSHDLWRMIVVRQNTENSTGQFLHHFAGWMIHQLFQHNVNTCCPLVNFHITMENHHFLWEKLTISMAIFNSKLLVYQRVILYGEAQCSVAFIQCSLAPVSKELIVVASHHPSIRVFASDVWISARMKWHEQSDACFHQSWNHIPKSERNAL